MREFQSPGETNPLPHHGVHDGDSGDGVYHSGQEDLVPGEGEVGPPALYIACQGRTGIGQPQRGRGQPQRGRGLAQRVCGEPQGGCGPDMVAGGSSSQEKILLGAC